jgi:hypothetical protein
MVHTWFVCVYTVVTRGQYTGLGLTAYAYYQYSTIGLAQAIWQYAKYCVQYRKVRIKRITLTHWVDCY